MPGKGCRNRCADALWDETFGYSTGGLQLAAAHAAMGSWPRLARQWASGRGPRGNGHLAAARAAMGIWPRPARQWLDARHQAQASITTVCA
jgi:hypothetical protein